MAKTLPKHITERDGTLYYQVRVPKDVKEHPDYRGKIHIKRSLGTSDLKQAERKAVIVGGEIHAAFDRARDELVAMRTPRRIETMSDAEADAFIAKAVLAVRMASGMGSLAKTATPEVGELVPWTAQLQNLSLSPELESMLRQRLYEALSAQPPAVTEADRVLADERRHLEPTYSPPPLQKPMTLAELIQAFETDDDRKHLQPETKRNFTTAFNVLTEVLGKGKNIRHVTRQDFKQVRRVLVHLPPHATNAAYNPQYEGWSYGDIAADVMERLESGEAVDTLKPNVVGKYLRSVGTLFNYALTEGYVDANLALKLAPKRQDGEEEEGRIPFSNEQLKTIFPHGWTPQDDVDWMLVLSLYHGTRGNETAQLHVTDIEDVDGIAVMEIRTLNAVKGKPDKDKRVKNSASRRTVPLHRKVIEMGFLDHVRRRRESGELRVFDTKPYGRGSCYESIRKDIDRRLTDLGVKTERTTFHSLRHNFRDACRDARLPDEHYKLIGGWSTGGDAESRYGRGTLIAMLKESLDQLAYPIEI